MAILDGTNDDDVIDGTEDGDVIRGALGDDTLNGNGGNDTIFGGGGNDRIDGGPGNDYLSGGSNNDVVLGGTGDDTIIYGVGDDLLDGQAGSNTLIAEFSPGQAGNVTLDPDNFLLISDVGNATIYNFVKIVISTGDGDDFLIGSNLVIAAIANDEIDAGEGNNHIEGRSGNDTLIAGSGDDFIDGGIHNDIIQAGDGNNTVLGGDGNDRITTGRGNDLIDGGADDDRIAVNGGVDLVDGGTGFDTLVIDTSFDEPVRTIDVDWDSGALSIDGAVSTFTGIERFDIRSGLGDDSIVTGDANDFVQDQGGNNRIETRGGDDAISIRTGSATVDAGSGNDRIVIDGLSVFIGDTTQLVGQLDGGSGDDRLEAYGVANGTLDASAGTFTWDLGSVELSSIENYRIEARGDNVLIGGDGTNTFRTQDGDDTLVGGSQADTLEAGAGNNIVEGRGGNDIIRTSDGGDVISGGDGSDTITVDSGSNDIDGGSGNDLIFVNPLTATGTIGTNTIDAGDGADRITVNSSMATNIVAGAGSDFVTILVSDPNSVSMTVDGGDGDDTFTFRLGDPAGVPSVQVSFGTGEASWSGGSLQFSGFENHTFQSGDGDDVFFGGDANVLVFGEGGDDKFYAGTGEGLFAGGDGFDQYFLTGNFADYQLVQFQAGNFASFQNAVGTRYIAQAEEFIFEDGVFDVATGEFTPSEVTNTSPEAVDDASDVEEDGETSGNVLANDSDADGDSISVISVNGLPVGVPIVGIYGTLMLAADGSFTYSADQPAADRLADGSSADDVFTYVVSDGEAASTATLTINVAAVSDGRFVVGTDQNDVLPGGDLNDVIDGLGGNDRLLGGDGDDLLDGGDADDRLNGGDGDDYLIGGDGNDILLGNDGDDVLVGGNGDDLMVGHEGADTFVVGGEAGSHDTIRDFEVGVDALQFANDASIIAVLEATGSSILSLSDGSSVTLNGISEDELAEILEPIAGENQMEGLLSSFSDSETSAIAASLPAAGQGDVLDVAIDPVSVAMIGLAPDPLNDQPNAEPSMF